MVLDYLNRRYAGRFHSTLIHQLTRAAAEAAERGDTAAALAFQQEIDRIRDRMNERKETFIGPRPAEATSKDPFEVRLVAVQWAGLPSGRLVQSPSACLIDCGDRGTVSITATGVSFTGELENDPAAIMLAVRHGQMNWPSGIVFHGSAEEGFKIAVAAKMLGVKVKGAKIPRARRAEAKALMLEWKPQLDSIRYGSGPARPARSGSAPSVTISRVAVA